MTIRKATLRLLALGALLAPGAARAFPSPPTAMSDLPAASTVATLSAYLSGRATDQTNVTSVNVSLKDLVGGQCFNWSTRLFNQPCPTYQPASLSPASGQDVRWQIGLLDSELFPGKRYAMEAVADDGLAQTGTVHSTFTYSPVQAAFGGTDGQGVGAIGPAATQGCQSMVATMTFTVGAAGLELAGSNPGGAVAVRIPDGWTRPASAIIAGSPPTVEGEVKVFSSNTPAVFASTVVVNPDSHNGVILGDNWILLKVIGAVAFSAGDTITFSYKGFTPSWPLSVEPQVFDVRSQSTSTGTLRSIGVVPIMTLSPGPLQGVGFTSYEPLVLGPLQTSPTMQFSAVDGCGTPTTVASNKTVHLSAFAFGNAGSAQDLSAQFFYDGGASTGAVVIPSGQGLSDKFYYRTSTSAPGEIVIGTPESLTFDTARYVSLSTFPVLVTGVSIDTGTLNPATTSVTLNPAAGGSQATIRFTVARSDVYWELVLSTGGVNAYPAVFRAFGSGDPYRPQTVSWNGIDCEQARPGEPCRAVKPGRYKARIRAGAGVAQSLNAVEVNVLPSAFIHGTITGGAGAFVRAEGPGTNYGHFLRATTGYFELRGLQAGQAYNVIVDSDVFVAGQRVSLSTGAFGVTATLAGSAAGPLALPQSGFLRVQARLPVAAPRELWGGVYAHTQDYRSQARGTLHYRQGFASSDDGGEQLGQSASTWTALGLAPGVYDIEVELGELGISTRAAGVSISAGQLSDLTFNLQRKTNVSGYAVLPSTTQYGAHVSIQATRGGERVPSLFSGVYVFGSGQSTDPTSGTYTLFGLDPGTWTLQAQSRGFVSYSTTVFLTGNEDLEDLDLTLGAGRVIVGTVTIVGDSSRALSQQGPTAAASQGLPVYVQAYNPLTFESSDAQIFIATSATVASGTFTITGLSTGPYQVNTYIRGFEKNPPGPSTATVTLGAAPSVSLVFEENSSRILFTIHVPRPASCPVVPASDTFKNVGFATLGGPDAQPNAYADITKVAGNGGAVASYHCSSMTLLSPPTGTGYYSFQFMHGPTGNQKRVSLPLTNRSTTTATVRLDESTFTVSGIVSLTGDVNVSQSGFSVNVSSVAGLLSQSASAGYCLLSSSQAGTFSNMHVELVPLDPHDRRLPGPLLSSSGISCSSFTLSQQGGGGPDASPSLAAYVGVPSATGYYQISGVPAGSYLLRTPGDLNGQEADGFEIAPFSRLIQVGSDTTDADVPLGEGVRVSGRVRLPEGVSQSRPVRISLTDGAGQVERAVILNFNNENSLSYVFDKVADGRHVVAVEDWGFPKTFVAQPLALEASGSDLQDQDLDLVPGAVIKGKIAIEQVQADGGKVFALVTNDNKNLLPNGTRVNAVANPWTIGGFVSAQGENCGPQGCGGLAIDENGQFTIQPLLPGLSYDVEAEIPIGFSNIGSGGLNLVPAVRSGISVQEGQTADIGILRVRAGLTVTGEVTVSGSTQAIANIELEARPAVETPGQDGRRRQLPRAKTDSGGRYTLTGLDPEVRFYDIVANRREDGDEDEVLQPYEQAFALAVDVRSTPTVNFSLLSAPYWISGRVLGVVGTPLLVDGERGPEPGALIFVEKSGVTPVETPIGDIMHLTNPDGTFTIPALSSGTYRLRVSALDYSGASRVVRISTGPAGAGNIQLSLGATLSGTLRKSDGSFPAEDEIHTVAAATANFDDLLIGTLTRDPNTRTVSEYRVSGFRAGSSYRLLLVGDGDQLVVPDGASNIVFTSSAEARNLDITVKPPRPFVLGTSRRSGSEYLVEFVASHPLRGETSNDDDLTSIVSTISATGALSDLEMDADRRRISGIYTPGVGESSFTVRFAAYSAFEDPDSLDPVNPEFFLVSTFTFYTGVDGYHRGSISNFSGGDLVIEGDSGRVKLPPGALAVEVSSSVSVTFQKSSELLPGSRTSAAGLSPAEANIKSLRHKPDAYPGGLFRAMAATPPELSPFSAFYDILLPLGVRTALSKAAEITVHYSSGTDPTTLNVYWYNEAANAYILEQNFGVRPTIDTVNRTITIKVAHFSTFVVFNTGVAVISGNAFGGGEIEAYNFPNPFDLSVKTVTPIHGLAPQSVRGTMVRFAVPPGLDGAGKIKVFNVAGELVRTIDLGSITGGRYYYQGWDGRNDSGRDVASGVYIGQVKIGEKSKFFKMALIK